MHATKKGKDLQIFKAFILSCMLEDLINIIPFNFQLQLFRLIASINHSFKHQEFH